MLYKPLEKKLGFTFENRELLQTVFIHRSFVNEQRRHDLQNNERLEFLGDAVLELVVTEYLFLRFPDQPEGVLTNWRSALVKGENLSKIAIALELGDYLFLSRGEEKSGGREKNYLLANTCEALIGAIYLDKNYDVVKQFIMSFIVAYLDDILEQKLHIDSKSQFQEMSQSKLGITPVYNLVKDEGPDHKKTFTMGAYLGTELIAIGKGYSKQKAESEAAENALKLKGWKK